VDLPDCIPFEIDASATGLLLEPTGVSFEGGQELFCDEALLIYRGEKRWLSGSSGTGMPLPIISSCPKEFRLNLVFERFPITGSLLKSSSGSSSACLGGIDSIGSNTCGCPCILARVSVFIPTPTLGAMVAVPGRRLTSLLSLLVHLLCYEGSNCCGAGGKHARRMSRGGELKH
jgi:hypothetical protein